MADSHFLISHITKVVYLDIMQVLSNTSRFHLNRQPQSSLLGSYCIKLMYILIQMPDYCGHGSNDMFFCIKRQQTYCSFTGTLSCN